MVAAWNIDAIEWNCNLHDQWFGWCKGWSKIWIWIWWSIFECNLRTRQQVCGTCKALHEEGVELYILSCERPLFTFDVGWDHIFGMQLILQERLWFQKNITRLGIITTRAYSISHSTTMETQSGVGILNRMSKWNESRCPQVECF